MYWAFPNFSDTFVSATLCMKWSYNPVIMVLNDHTSFQWFIPLTLLLYQHNASLWRNRAVHDTQSSSCSMLQYLLIWYHLRRFFNHPSNTLASSLLLYALGSGTLGLLLVPLLVLFPTCLSINWQYFSCICPLIWHIICAHSKLSFASYWWGWDVVHIFLLICWRFIVLLTYFIIRT